MLFAAHRRSFAAGLRMPYIEPEKDRQRNNDRQSRCVVPATEVTQQVMALNGYENPDFVTLYSSFSMKDAISMASGHICERMAASTAPLRSPFNKRLRIRDVF